ncbi:MAG: hypothetical protein BWY92_01657 [Firmicutes bacterium ADurb.BinA052]|nr:MAG: hypothetical protein BWY92_01657 [Firmicutes bacterium ADurb.BinA052]
MCLSALQKSRQIAYFNAVYTVFLCVAPYHRVNSRYVHFAVDVHVCSDIKPGCDLEGLDGLIHGQVSLEECFASLKVDDLRAVVQYSGSIYLEVAGIRNRRLFNPASCECKESACGQESLHSLAVLFGDLLPGVYQSAVDICYEHLVVGHNHTALSPDSVLPGLTLHA